MRSLSKQHIHFVISAAITFLAACGFTAPAGVHRNHAGFRTPTVGASADMSSAGVPSVATREVRTPALAAKPPGGQVDARAADGDTGKSHPHAFVHGGRLTAPPERQDRFQDAKDNLDLILAPQVAREKASQSGALKAMARARSPALDSVLGSSIFGRDAAHVLGNLNTAAAEDPYGPLSIGQLSSSSGSAQTGDDSIAMGQIPGGVFGARGPGDGRGVGSLPAKDTFEGPGGDGGPVPARTLARHGTNPPGRS